MIDGGRGREVEEEAAARSARAWVRDGGLGLGDQALDAGQGGVLADGVDLHPYRGVGRHGAGDHRVAVGASTGRDSPVIIDSSKSALPSTIMPSAGIRAPDRTSTMSPTARSATATVSVPSSVDPLGLVRQQRRQGVERAPGRAERPHLDPVSQQHDDQQGASSHQKSRSPHPIVVANEDTYATVMAMEISSIIPGCRLRTSVTPPTRNGFPPHR